ncbi:MAG: DUF2889 domain-containing protein [Desulfatiglandaceae bacterium]
MTRLRDLIQNTPVHERRLEFRTYPLEGDRLIVEGWLRDERLVPGYHWNGKSRPTGVVHWMCVRLLVGGWPVTILDAEAEMPDIPHELCPTTLESVKRIVGLSIVSGYSEEVHRRLGGVQGCAHLTHLIVTMGPAALHGYWTQQSRERRPIPRSLDEFQGLTTLINSCKLWKEDGPLMQMIRETLERHEKENR